MAKSLIQVANQSFQPVAINSIINLGSTQRRYGSNLRLSGNGIEVSGEGYYAIDCNVAVAPTNAGPVTVALAPHARLPEILVVPREKSPTGAGARGNP